MSENDGNQSGGPRRFDVRAFLRAALRVLIEIVLSLAVGCAAAYQTFVIACDAAKCNSGTNTAAIPIMLLAAVVGVVAVGVYFLIYRIKGRVLRVRHALDAVAIVAVLVLLVYPLVQTELRERARQEQFRAQQKAADDKYQAARLAWIAKLRASDAHGPPGAVPPMLKAEDDGIKVVVENTTAKGLTVALTRVIEQPSAPTGWRGCPMRTSGKTGGTYHSYWVGPGERITYEPDAPCAEKFRGAAVEYRIGKDQRDIGWWSESAFAAPDGRQNQTGD